MAATVQGPLFDGTAQRELVAFANTMVAAVADAAVEMVRDRLRSVLQHPTGRYEKAIHAVPSGDSFRLTDSDVVYGPWLEGVSSRNRTTRFKGYSTFRKVRDELAQRAPSIAEKVLPPFLERMNR
jgi:hypothetical protein